MKAKLRNNLLALAAVIGLIGCGGIGLKSHPRLLRIPRQDPGLSASLGLISLIDDIFKPSGGEGGS